MEKLVENTVSTNKTLEFCLCVKLVSVKKCGNWQILLNN